MNDLAKIEDYGCTPGTCPSELELDQYQLGELEPIQRAAVARAVESCAGCTQRYSAIEAGFSAFSELDASALGQRIVQGFEGHLPTELSAVIGDKTSTDDGGLSWFEQILFWLGTPSARGMIIGAAVLVTFMVFQPDQVKTPAGEADSITGVRMKGPIGFAVFRARGETVEQVSSGDEFRAGDRLRFDVTTPRIGHIMILGRETSGKVYMVYPLDRGNKAALKQPGRDSLPGSVALDQSLGKESLHIVFCPKAFDRDAIDLDSPGAGLSADCVVSQFDMNKVK